MSNVVQVTNNVTKNTVEVTAGGASTALTITNSTTNNTVELNSGLFFPSPVATLGDIADVTLTGVSSSDLIWWSGSAWINITPSTVVSATNLSAHSDVIVGTVVADEALVFNGVSWVNRSVATMLGSGDIEDLNNVNSGATSTQVLQYDGFNWDPVTLNLQDITDGGTTTTDTITAGGFTSAGAVIGGAVVSGTWALPITGGTVGQYLSASGWDAIQLTDLDNVVDTSATGDILIKGASDWETTTPTLDTLDSVDTSGAGIGDGLVYDGAQWVASPSSGGASIVGDLLDVTLTGLTDEDLLQYNSGTGDWENVAASSVGATTLAALTDTSVAGEVTGQILMWTGADWSNLSAATMAGSYLNLEDLADVTETTITSGDLLRWNGSAWVNYADSNYATAAQGVLADSALQVGNNVSLLANDSGYLTDITGEDISDLNDVLIAGQAGGDMLYAASASQWANAPFSTISGIYSGLNNHSDVTLTASTTGDVLRYNGSAWVNYPDSNFATSAQGTLADSATQPGDNVSTLTNDAGYITTLGASNLEDLADVTETTITTGDVLRWNGSAWVNYADSAYATSAQGTLADSATQPGDNVSTLTNDSGFITDITGEPIGDLSDVGLGALTTGEVLMWTGANWANLSAATVTGSFVNLEDLADVTETTITTGDLLRWNGSAWVNYADTNYATGAEGDLATSATQPGDNISTLTNDSGFITGISTLETIGDVTETTITTGDVLRWNGSAWVNYADSAYATSAQGVLADSALQVGDNISLLTNNSGYITDITGEDLGDLSDTTVSGQTAGDIIYAGSPTLWANAPFSTISGIYSGLNNHSDVTLTASTTGDVLRYNGSAWVNYPDSNFADASHTHTHVDITDFDTEVDARIGVAVLDDLSDVVETTITTNDTLQWNGSNWVNEADITTGDLSATAATFDGNGSGPYLSTLAVKAGGSSVFIQEWNDSSGTLNAYMFPSGNFVTTGTGTFSGTLTTSTGLNSNTTALSANTFKSTDATATYWPALTIHRNSSTPADNDSLSGINFDGEDSGSAQTTYGRLEAVALDVTNGTEDGELQLKAMRAGTLTEVLSAGANGVTIDEAYTLPTTDGTVDQVLSTDGSGNVTWGDAGGGGNPWFNFSMNCYNTISTSEDNYYWYPGSSVYGFDGDTGTSLESATLSDTATWNRWKKMSHRLPSGTYDLDFLIDLSISTLSSGTTHASDAAGDTTTYYVYQVGRSGTNGDTTRTQIATGSIVQDATDTAVGTEVSFSTSGTVFDGEERILIILKHSGTFSATRYAHWVYDIQAEKTA